MTDPTETELGRLRRQLGEESRRHAAAFQRAAANGQALIEARAELEQLRAKVADSAALYRERACLLAFLAIQHDSVLAFSDPNEPEWAVLTVSTTAGQMTWHISPGDLHLFTGIPFVEATDPQAAWDGHDTPEKYRRLAELTAEHRAWINDEAWGPVDEAWRLLGELAQVDEKAATALQVKWMSAGADIDADIDADDVIQAARAKLQAARGNG